MPRVDPAITTIRALGRALRDRRRSRRLTQRQIAEASGIAQPTISNVERGETGVSLQTLLRLLSALDLELVLRPRPTENLTRLWDRGG